MDKVLTDLGSDCLPFLARKKMIIKLNIITLVSVEHRVLYSECIRVVPMEDMLEFINLKPG